MTLKATLDFLLILMAYRLRATAAAPASSAPCASQSLSASSPLDTVSGGAVGASADLELPGEPLLAPHDSMELRRDLSVSVVQALSLRRHATTYRRVDTTHSAAHPNHEYNCSLTSLMGRRADSELK